MFPSHDQVGGLYGFNFITNKHLEELENSEFSIDNALSVLGNLQFNEDSDREYDTKRYPYEIIEYVVSGKEIEVYGSQEDGFTDTHGEVHDLLLNELIEDGVLNYKVVSRKEAIGKYLYKWVTNDLRSYYRKDFQYTLGEWVEPLSGYHGYTHYDGTLYMHKYDQVHHSSFKQDRILICEYKENDIKSLTHDKVLVSSVKPIGVVETFEQLQAFLSNEGE